MYAIAISHESIMHSSNRNFSDMLQSVDRLIIYCIVIRLAVTQGQRLQSQNGQNLALKPSESDVKCSEDVSCYTDGNSLVDTIANIDSQVLCQQLCQVMNFFHCSQTNIFSKIHNSLVVKVVNLWNTSKKA